MMAAPALALPAEPAESKQPATTSTTTMKQPQPKSGVYQLDDEWTQDIEYNPESFVKEYPKLKKLLETFALNPVAYTADIIKMINKYQEKPELLDPHLQEMCDLTMRYIQPHLAERDTTLINDPQFITHCALQIIYTLSIVRGYKTVIRYLPHEVSDLEPTLHFLLAIDQQLLSLWYSRYVLCIWLSIIVRVPFNLHSIDSFGDLIDKILTTVKAYLGRSEKAREGAAVLVSRLFSRPDFEQTHMKDFFEWALDQLEQLKEEHNIFLFTGIFRALAEIFKHAHRDALLPNAPLILERAGKIWSTNKSRVVRKYATKLIQRIGLVFLKPVVASWRYTKSRHVLMEQKPTNNSSSKGAGDTEDVKEEDFYVPQQIEFILDLLLNSLRDRETVVRWSAAKGIGRITMRLPKILGDEIITNVLELLSPTEDHQAWHGGCLCLAELSRRGLLLPGRIGGVIERISAAMVYDVFQGQSSVGDQVRDAACYVAWAFARAYEPSLMEAHVPLLARSLLTMAVFDKEIHCRRAACAAFQENVGRQGNFAHGIEIITTADYWSVGLMSNAYLRVSKSIAQFAEYRTHLIDHLVHSKLTYWDLKNRTLAGQALHELTELDVEYMATQVLPILINRCQSQSVFERHGALCGVAQIISRLSELGHAIDTELQKHIKNIVPKLEKNRGYRGRGGERVRQEACNVMAAICTAKFPLSDKGIDRYVQSIDENLRIPQEFVQDAALKALSALSKGYHTESASTEARRQKVTLKWCKELKTEIIASVTRGYARGLGALSVHMIGPHLKDVVDALITKSLITAQEETRDFETRKFCCIALADLLENIGVSEAMSATYAWTPAEDEKKADDDADDDDELKNLGIDLDVTKEKHERSRHHKAIEDERFEFMFSTESAESALLYDRIVSALLLRFEDYEVDRRGDVGSFVREHNLKQTVRALRAMSRAGLKSDGATPWMRPSWPTLVLNAVLRQLSEKLDRVRRAAGEMMELLFDSDDAAISALRFDDDAQIRSIFAGRGGTDWSNPSEVFPLLVRALDLPAYRRSIVEGLLQSIGCINSTMSRLTLDALESYMNGLSESIERGDDEGAAAESRAQLTRIGGDLVHSLTKRFLNPLFTVPFLKAIGILLSDKIYFEPLQNDGEGEKFAKALMAQLKRECFKSTDILKLLTSIKVFVGLSLFASTREAALQRLMVFMGYQYPALRKQTATELLTAISTFGELIIKNEEKQNAAFDFLSENVWGGSDLERVRAQRNELFDMFEIRPPKLKGLKTKKKALKGGSPERKKRKTEEDAPQ